MSRANDRAKRKLERNPVVECNKIQQKYCPNLFSRFKEVRDPRNQSYIEYSSMTMLGTLYYKGIAGISSMQEMTRQFNDETVSKNLNGFIDGSQGEYLPHGVTLNEYLERLDPKELEMVITGEIKDLIRRKTFNNARFKNKWVVIVDGTELDEGYIKKNEGYLSRCYNAGTENEFTKYHRSVLEAKLYLGKRLLISMASEPIENSAEYNEKKMSEAAIKQDCESKAFIRLAAKLKKRFPRLPIILLADALYVTDNVISICEKYEWDYLIRYKKGAASSIATDYDGLPEYGTVGKAEFANQIVFGKHDVNVLKFEETKIKKGQKQRTEFAWITNIEITEKNAEKMAEIGRLRWKIENQGFNRQKRWQGDIEHACSYDAKAQMNHYLMEQISDFIKQLYEFFYLEKLAIIKPQKNISSELLASFGQHLINPEDTLYKEILTIT